jgi:hypothetical protein
MPRLGKLSELPGGICACPSPDLPLHHFREKDFTRFRCDRGDGCVVRIQFFKNAEVGNLGI